LSGSLRPPPSLLWLSGNLTFWKKRDSSENQGNNSKDRIREMEQVKVPSMIKTKVTNSLKGSVLDLIQRDYQFIAGGKIQKMFANDLLEAVNKSYRDPWKLEVGQILWYGRRLRRSLITVKTENTI
jgi:Protein of unknown function (DUF1670)